MELYVHIPFCVKKCRYCSFVSFAGREACIDEYICLLIKEAESRLAECSEPVSTIYIGGGTPSLIPAESFRRLMIELMRLLPLKDTEEFTVEANPGILSDEWLRTAISYGANRLSVGMQAKQDHLLKTLGRIHCFNDVQDSVRLARKAGITNLNLDLMFGIPGQTIDQWKETLQAALSLQPEHISAYGLIPEENTPIWHDLQKGILTLPDPEEEREMYDIAIHMLAEAGLNQYEISNFAVSHMECRHNIGYWQLVPYLGLGVSAASMLGLRFGRDGMRYIRRVNPSTPEEYRTVVEHPELREADEQIGPAEARFETMMLGLRMNMGVEEKKFFSCHNVQMRDIYGKKLAKMQLEGLMQEKDGYWMLTRRGFDIQNSILVELMDE